MFELVRLQVARRLFVSSFQRDFTISHKPKPPATGLREKHHSVKERSPSALRCIVIVPEGRPLKIPPASFLLDSIAFFARYQRSIVWKVKTCTPISLVTTAEYVVVVVVLEASKKRNDNG